MSISAGCYRDRNIRVLPNQFTYRETGIVGHDRCEAAARAINAPFFGLQAGRECYYGELNFALDRYGQAPDIECRSKCGDRTELSKDIWIDGTEGQFVCGGGWRLSMYQLVENDD